MDDEFYTIDEVVQKIRIPKSTLYKLSQQGRIPSSKIGKQLRFRRSSLERWLSAGENKVKMDSLISGSGQDLSLKKTSAKSVLLIDDDSLILKSLTRFLEHHNYRLKTAESGREALRKLKQENFDLIIVDIRMPGFDGIETIRRIREFNRNLRRLPPGEVIITGYADPEAEREAEKLGITDFIYKPFATREFLELIERKLKK